MDNDRVRTEMFAPYVDELSSGPDGDDAEDNRTLAIEAAMRRVQLARENWYAVMFGSYRFIDDSAFTEHQKAEAAAREAIIKADMELSELLQAAAAGAVAVEQADLRVS